MTTWHRRPPGSRRERCLSTHIRFHKAFHKRSVGALQIDSFRLNRLHIASGIALDLWMTGLLARLHKWSNKNRQR